jgi:excisionase family DNA binding protein
VRSVAHTSAWPREGTRSRDTSPGGGGTAAEPLTLAIPDVLAERIAERAAEIALERLRGEAGVRSPYLTVPEAAEYLRAKPQRVYDLLSSRRLTRYRDGRRVLVSRAELDAYLAENGSRPVAPTWPPRPGSRMGKGVAA